MSAFRIVIDRSLCSGFGSCVEHAPQAIALDRGGVAAPVVPDSDDPAVLDAAGACPMGAIEIWDRSTGRRVA